MKIAKLVQIIEDFAPLSLQENYDNSGLIIGNPEDEINGALICLDVTREIIEEAVQKKLNMIISHHPLIFKGITKINQKNEVERLVVKAIKNNIAVYAMHTNADNLMSGVNGMIAEKIGLRNSRALEPGKDLFRKLVTFCPNNHAESIREALFQAGAGQIGDYDQCSFNIEGNGTFRANDHANPFVGKINELHTEPETRIETIYPAFKEKELLKALMAAHPYEEVAYDIYKLENKYHGFGSGLIGNLSSELSEKDFFEMLKDKFKTGLIRHSSLRGKPIKNVAVCGGAGSFLINKAKASGADIFISGDIKYHEFFEGDKNFIIADIGHYESEQFTKELILSILIKKIPNFALQISAINTNPINYFK